MTTVFKRILGLIKLEAPISLDKIKAKLNDIQSIDLGPEVNDFKDTITGLFRSFTNAGNELLLLSDFES